MLSERTQSEKATYCVIPAGIWKRQNYGESKKITDFQEFERRKGSMSG